MSFSEFQDRVSNGRAQSEAQRGSVKSARQKADKLQREKDRLLREIGANTPDANKQLDQIRRAQAENAAVLTAGEKAYRQALRDEWAQLNEDLAFTDPVMNIGGLNDDCPILLFPLRLETRFKKVTRDGVLVDQLWVRVFPDDIAINSFESDFSDSEIRNTRRYWTARWKAGKDVDANRAAWRGLVSAHGSGRAYWLVMNYVPLNLADEPEKAEGEIILAIGTDTPLSGPALSAVTTYWQAVWRADQDKAATDRAWTDLVDAVGADQASTLSRNYLPANLADPPPVGFTRDSAAVRVQFVVFEPTDALETRIHGWSQPPASSVLPERFVLLTFNAGVAALPPQLGALVPPRLILGPDPAAPEGEDFRLAGADDAGADPAIQEGDLIFSENLRWLFEFDEAVARGMGFKIDLTPAQAANGFDRLFVLGLKLSADKARGQALLEDLFMQHQSSRKGLAILRQGTPTNNTEDDPAGYSWREDPDASFDNYFGDAANTDPADGFARRDGRWLAEMLGIDPATLRNVENYYATDRSEARAMQQALWPATMGHFLDSLMNPVFSKDAIEQTRAFFTRYVSGRGCLPVIRVGKQPYGILPATNYTNMQWFVRPSHDIPTLARAVEPGAGNHFLQALYRILLELDQTWTGLLQRVAYIGKDGDPHQILLDVVGLHPDSVEIYKRYANTLKQIHNLLNIKGFAHETLSGAFPTSYAAASALLAKYGYPIDAGHPAPDILNKAFFAESMLLHGDRIDKVPVSEVEPIGPWTTDGKNYIAWLSEAAGDSHDRLRLQDGFIDDTPPTALLYLLLYHALDLSYIDTSLKLHLSKGVMNAVQMQRAYLEPDFIHIETDNETESRWKYLYKADSRITGSPTMQLGSYIPQQIATLDEAAAFRDTLAGLRALQDVPTARLERLMMEHIDTVSYRYDAWILGYLQLQLETMRGLPSAGAEGETRSGCYLGAYGWLEDVRPENKILTPVNLPDELQSVFNPHGDLVQDSSNAGYILALSQNHAVTAAVLRNGYISNETPQDSEALKIKLSSQRVRAAMQIIEGIQGGQSLPALLGYQFERGLHNASDANVDGFILELRNAFPLAAKKFNQTAPGAEDTEYQSIDQIEAKNVIDGVALLEHIDKTGNKTYPFGLGLPPAGEDQQRAIDDQIVNLIDLNDAVADLALAESVHQVVLGNFERAAATLDTYSKGHAPPTPDVIQTPRSGIQLTHRVGLQFRPGLSHSTGEPGVTPRMIAEPAMHDWLVHNLPGMDEVVCVVTYTDRVSATVTEQQVSLQDIGLAHIDALYLLHLDGEQVLSALDDLVIQHVMQAFTPRADTMPAITYMRKLDAGRITVFEMTSLIASLRALLLKSKPLNAADVKLANEAAKQNEQSLSLDPARIQAIIAQLRDLRTNELATFITHLDALIAADNAGNIVATLDTLLQDASQLFIRASRYGMPQTGIGFVYQWQQGLYTQTTQQTEILRMRWEDRRTAYQALRDAYNAGVGSISDDELYAILKKAELTLSTTVTADAYPTPAAYFAAIDGTTFMQFENLLDNVITPISSIYGLTPRLQALQVMAVQLPPFDSIGFDLTDLLRQVTIFAGDVLTGAQNLSGEMQKREILAADKLGEAAATAQATAQVALIAEAARAIFGDEFVVVPEFGVEATQGSEWQNTLQHAEHSLRYLLTDLDMDFPLDDWLYGISRVREKLHHVENTLLHVEGFGQAGLQLVPAQFPYRPDDYWLGLQFPATRDGSDEPFTVDEDKLLYTAIYSEPFDPARAQCGLLLDEWTEVIPSREETAGLSFHFDQPNSEPPNGLLLATPSNFTGHWQWDDLVRTLHETLDMAKKRAVEPDHVDTTVFSHFLPPIVSLTSPLPLTATLNLVRNNQVFFDKVFKNE